METIEDRPLKMPDDFNEKNLIHLNEEASQFLEENSQRKDNNEEIINMKYYIEELSKKLMEKEDKVQNQSFQMQTLNLLVENLKKNTKSLHEKLAEYEKLKIHINAQNKKTVDLENEISVLKQEYQ